MKSYLYGDPKANTVLIQMVDDHDLAVIENELSELRDRTDTDFQLIAVKVDQWNHDLSPWKAPAVFGKDVFEDGAADTLAEVLKLTGDPCKTYYIGGYSLAGLFALWAVHQTNVFQGAAAASPSVWFPGFTDWMRTKAIQCPAVYLSLGDKESKTRNPVMASVADRIREAQELLLGQGTHCVLEWNQGNHFREPDLRMAKAFSWILKCRQQRKE